MLGRYLGALWKSIRLTLKRESPYFAHLRQSQPELADWCAETTRQVDVLMLAAQQASLQMDSLIVRVDGRNQSMSIILQAVRFHSEQEYPFLVAGGDQYVGLALQATNLNDRFAVSQLIKILPEHLKPACEQLAGHLEKQPGLGR